MNQVAKVNEKTRLQTRSAIYNLEDFLHSCPDEAKIETDPLIEHFFAPGVYVRQMKIPKDMVVVGKIHKTRHVSIISCGHVTVTTESGMEDIHGPHTFINEPGDKRAVYAHEDTIWTTVHPTCETDLAKIEREVIANDYMELEGPQTTLRIEE
jgi:hypothetical protein